MKISEDHHRFKRQKRKRGLVKLEHRHERQTLET